MASRGAALRLLCSARHRYDRSAHGVEGHSGGIDRCYTSISSSWGLDDRHGIVMDWARWGLERRYLKSRCELTFADGRGKRLRE